MKRSRTSSIALRIAARSPHFSASSQRGPSGNPARWLITWRIVTAAFAGTSRVNSGQYFAVDAASGRTLWLSEGRAGENAAVLAGDDVLFFLDTDGTLTVAAADPSAFRPLRQWKVAASATWAHPVVMPDAVLVKDVDTLLLLRLR